MKKSAFAAVVGRPSVGKSTLVNRLCGGKVAIVSPVPQTTRNAIRGICSRGEGQIVFVDTPGRHASEKKFNKMLMDVSDHSLSGADLVLYVLDASRPPGAEEEAVACALAPLQDKLFAAINKIDMEGPEGLAPVDNPVSSASASAFLRERLPLLKPERIFRISALKNEGLEPLVSALLDAAPEGEPFYGEEYYTDQDVQFRIAEIIREKAINRLRQELPHSLYVDVADTEFREGGASADDAPKKLWVRAFIVVERESQKGMVVGKGGGMIKAIRMAAQKDLNRIFDWKIELDLRVKTGKDWRHNEAVLKKLTGR